MLQIHLDEKEFFDERSGEFINIKPVTLQLEHSLISLSKWESKWKKPFLDKNSQWSQAELIDYVRCMTINNVDPQSYLGIDSGTLQEIEKYISESQTATKIYDRRPQKGGRNEPVMTSELIYYYMIAHGIPFECQKWHLSRLLTLIRICGIKGTPAMMSQQDLFLQNKQLNAARRAAMNSKG